MSSTSKRPNHPDLVAGTESVAQLFVRPVSLGQRSYGMLAADWTLKEEPDERLELLRHHGLLPSAAPSRHCCEVNG